MGYRQYFYKLDKNLVRELRECQTHTEVIDVCKHYAPQAIIDGESGNISPYRLGEEIFEFGKGYENASELYKHGNLLFSTPLLNERYKEYGIIICDESAIKSAIEWQHNKIADYYEELLREEPSDMYDTRPQIQRIISHLECQLNEWRNKLIPELKPYELNKDKDRICRSWLYEYTIWDLVRIYKTFDWEKYDLVFMGW